ncbi:MAG: putative metal-binding motif-containing protein, partial [Myxococcota bacterium]
MRLLPLVVLTLACRVSKEDATPLPEDTAALTSPDADGDGWSDEEDCAPTDATISPSGVEACDGVDQDCDGAVDDGVTTTVYADADGDGVGAGDALGACTVDPGYAIVDGDCDDADATVFPGAQEVCDGVDSDCDGGVDEDGQTLWFTDADGDGYGDPATGEQACEAAGRVADYGD